MTLINTVQVHNTKIETYIHISGSLLANFEHFPQSRFYVFDAWLSSGEEEKLHDVNSTAALCV